MIPVLLVLLVVLIVVKYWHSIAEILELNDPSERGK